MCNGPCLSTSSQEFSVEYVREDGFSLHFYCDGCSGEGQSCHGGHSVAARAVRRERVKIQVHGLSCQCLHDSEPTCGAGEYGWRVIQGIGGACVQGESACVCSVVIVTVSGVGGHDLCVNSALFVPPHQSLCDVLLKEGVCCLAILCEKQRIDFISKK